VSELVPMSGLNNRCPNVFGIVRIHLRPYRRVFGYFCCKSSDYSRS